MPPKKTKGKEKQAQNKKTAETHKEENKNASAPISAVPVQQVEVINEEPEQDNVMTTMEILQDTQDQKGGWEGSNTGGNDGWGMDVSEGGGWGEDVGEVENVAEGENPEGSGGKDANSDYNSWGPNQDSTVPPSQAAVQGWESASQSGLFPRHPPAPAPPPSPPIPVTTIPQTMGEAKPGGSKPSGHISADSGAQHDQSAGQSWALPNPSLRPSAATMTSASAMARGAKPAITSASGGKAVLVNQSGHNPRGQEYWGVPQSVMDASAKATRNPMAFAANVGHGSGGGSSRQSFSAWGQPKSVDPWGDPRVSGAKHRQTWDQSSDGASRWTQNGVQQQGRERQETQAWEKWGKPHGWTKPDSGLGDVHDDDEENTDSDEWDDAVDDWSQQHAQEWTRWRQENKKVTFAPLGSEGTKSVVSAQQRSDILNSLLNLSGQNQNVNAGHYGHLTGGLRHTQQNAQQKQPSKQQQQQEKQKQQQEKQRQQQEKQRQQQEKQKQQQQHPSQHQDHGAKKMKKQKGKQKETPKQVDAWGNVGGDSWDVGGGGGDGWGVGDDGWGDGAHADGGNVSARNDGWDAGDDSGGNDGWVDVNGWGDDNNGWDEEKVRGREKVRGKEKDRDNDKGWRSNKDKGWGQDQVWDNDSGWGAIPEEEEDEEEDLHPVLPVSSKNPQMSLWGGKQANTSYTMPSKTLAHAYKETTVLLNNGVVPNKLNEYTNVQFVESRGAALAPVANALFGKTRMAKDRIHWMFSPNKDERVSSLLSWIQKVEYSLGSFGVHKFIQSRERGAFLTNADFRMDNHPNQPAFDWLTFDVLQRSMDRTLQESVAFYDPTVQVIVFVFLPSKSGNSVAMWRRKVNVPNNTRLILQHEINLAMAGLRKQKNYAVHVDELPAEEGQLRHRSLPGDDVTTKNKRKWWQIFRFG